MATLPERFGPFVISGTVGAGGMGEVYRARDSRLHRDVAIKVLSKAGADAARRFTGEAQAASALNHPNIVTVYDVGAHGEVPYIVSELVDGTSLRSLLARAPLPVREVLDLAVQMADGLAAAHTAGIVHRDFKPENVMVTREGRVKILDFGLALVGTRAGLAPSTDVTLTQTGVIVGTIPYMSPEQARGTPVDYRTDQFSLGLTLYELVTGRRAFQKETAPQTLAAILEDEPEAIAKLNPRVPAPLRWVVERCLAKEPRQRYESTTDLARELHTLRDRLNEFVISADTTASAHRPRRSGVLVGVLSLAVGAFGAIGAAALARGDGADRGIERYRFTPFATDSGYQSSPAWSPDGKTLAYVAAVDGVLQVFTKALGSPSRTQVTHVGFDCKEVFWDADGTRLYYVSQARDRDGLWSVSSVGGDPELVMENVSRAAQSPDGKTLALLRSEGNDSGGVYSLWLSTPSGHEPTRYLTPPLGDQRFFDGVIRFSPDGSKVGAWIIQREFSPSAALGAVVSRFWIIPMRQGAPHLAPSVTTDASSFAFAAPFSWLPDSRHIVSALPIPRPGAHLWLKDTETTESQLITEGGSIESDPSVSPDGAHLAVTFQQANYDVYRVTLDGRAPELVLASSRNEMDPAWSAAASQMAFTTDRSGTDEIWLRSQNGEFERPLVTSRDFPKSPTYILASPSVSPDGQRVAYYREGPDGGNRIWMSPIAGGPPVALTGLDRIEEDMPTWSPDGAWIAFAQSAGTETAGLWSLSKMRVGATTPSQVIVPDILPSLPAKWSPDGAWIAFNSRNGLALVAPDGQSMQVISDQLWIAFDWSPDSRQLVGIRQSDDFKHLTLTSLDVRSHVERVVTAALMPLPIATRPVRGFTRVSPTAFLTSIVHVSSDVWLVDGFTPPSTPWDRLKARFGLVRD